MKIQPINPCPKVYNNKQGQQDTILKKKKNLKEQLEKTKDFIIENQDGDTFERTNHK